MEDSIFLPENTVVFSRSAPKVSAVCPPAIDYKSDHLVPPPFRPLLHGSHASAACLSPTPRDLFRCFKEGWERCNLMNYRNYNYHGNGEERHKITECTGAISLL